MNQLFLLKLIADFIKTDKPTVEEIRCARTILENLIKEFDVKQPIETSGYLKEDVSLDWEAQKAKQELMQ